MVLPDDDVPKLSISSDPIAGRQFAQTIIGFFSGADPPTEAAGATESTTTRQRSFCSKQFSTLAGICVTARTHTLAPSEVALLQPQAGGDDNFPKQHPTHTLTHWLVVGCCGQRRRDGTETFFWPRALSHFYFLPLFFCWIVAGKLEKQQSSPETTSRAIVQVAETFLKTASFSSFSQKRAKNHPPNRSGTET